MSVRSKSRGFLECARVFEVLAFSDNLPAEMINLIPGLLVLVLYPGVSII
jgi:hypothetical protein